MPNNLSAQFDQHQIWCVSFAKRLATLADWLEKNGLADQVVYAEVNRLRYQLSSQQVMVAVIAEFSRGKSELINALFFAHYGQRIMPAGAGRTTMCPAEIAWNPALPVGIRLLPIETRKDPLSLTHWRLKPESWSQFGFDPKDPDHMAQTIARLAHVQRISIADAQNLGFWFAGAQDGTPHPDNPIPDHQGRVEVPVWRHAIINIPHPLLAQGLVILDTPGLNAVGVEPELTMQLLGQAQATLFVLGADTGVTKSDLDLWREHLSHAAAAHIPRYAVLNKIDTLWDELKPPAQIAAELEKQCMDSAALLAINRSAVVAVSAQKGLIAKIQKNPVLLTQSRLPELETILGGHLVRERQTIIQQNCASGMLRLQHTAGKTLERKYREIADQKAELQSVAGKSQTSLNNMLKRMALEKAEIDQAGQDFGAIQEAARVGVIAALSHVATDRIKSSVAALGKSVEGSFLKVGLKDHYESTFSQLNFELQSCESALTRLHGDVTQKIKSVNTLHGFAIALSPVPEMTAWVDKLLNIRLSHLHHLEFGASWRLMNKDHLQRLLQTLYVQVRVVFEGAQAQIEQWAQELIAVLGVELSARRESLEKRQKSVTEVGTSGQALMQRIAQFDAQLENIRAMGQRLVALAKGVDSQVDAKRQQDLV